MEPQNSDFNSSALLAPPEGTMSCGHSSWGDTNTCLLIPGRAPTTDKVHLGEPVSFIGVIYMGEGSLTGPETTPWQLHHLLPAQVTAPKRWEPGAHYTACRPLSRLEGPIVVLSVSAVLSIVFSGGERGLV